MVVPFIGLEKTEQEGDWEEKIKSSVLDTLNLRGLLTMQIEILHRQLKRRV